MKIAIDLMGSDLGAAELIIAVKRFAKENPEAQLSLFGKKELIEIEGFNNIEVIDAPQEVLMTDGPLELLRKKDASMVKAIDYLAKKEVDAVVSCGSTGALLAAAMVKCKLIQGIERAGLITFFPTSQGEKKVAIVDVGATNENTPEQLRDYALLGRAFAQAIIGTEPKLYLLSNGSEEEKGSPIVKEAHKLLKGSPGFCGNMEARDVMSGRADVVVCGGFEGNILLKASEGCAKTVMGKLKKVFKTNLRTKIGYLLIKKHLNRELKSMDYRTTGGAMLAGINGIVIKAHGNSNSMSFYYALQVAKKLIDANVLEKMNG